MNVAAFEPVENWRAATMKMVETTPDITFTRTGVPSLALKTPNQPANAPSYAATAWMRSEPIIQTAPDVRSAKMNPSAITSARKFWAPPYTLNVVCTASRKPPMPEIWLVGSTSRMPKIGIP